MRAQRVRYEAVFLAVALALAGGCGSARQDPMATTPRQRPDMLTAQEVAHYANALEAIRTLRGQWLSRQSHLRRSPGVFVDGSLTPGLNTLAQYPADKIKEIRFLPGIEASTRFGSEHGAGAILVTTTR